MKYYKIEELLQIGRYGIVSSGPQLYKNIFGDVWKIFEIQNNNVCKFNSSKDHSNIKHRFKEFVK